MKKVILNSDPALRWENQARQYPEHGNGIVYFKGNVENGIWIDCLLYYGDDNLLQGVLNHYPFESSYQEKGSVNIHVRQDKRRNGIATTLVDEAIKMFNIKLDEQEYSPDGERFIKQYMRNSFKLSLEKFRRSKSKLSRNSGMGNIKRA